MQRSKRLPLFAAVGALVFAPGVSDAETLVVKGKDGGKDVELKVDIAADKNGDKVVKVTAHPKGDKADDWGKEQGKVEPLAKDHPAGQYYWTGGRFNFTITSPDEFTGKEKEQAKKDKAKPVFKVGFGSHSSALEISVEEQKRLEAKLKELLK